ncbi:MAG: DUF3592 domain-containing protein [Anaerolineae bacterium]|jgi:hypothetical protein|nr:DUF3592 domain-containing protein [Anaerolineae bacterium]
MENVFLLHPENRDFLRGQRRNFTTNGNTIMLLFPVIFGLAGLLFFGLGLQQYLADEQLKRDGVITRGIIDDLTIEEDSDDTDYYAFYWFEVNGVAYTRRASLNREQYADLEIGGGVEVIYLPTDPTTSRIVGEGGPIWLIMLLGGGFALFGLFGSIRVLSNMQAYRRLSREGKLIKSQIDRLTTRKDSDDDFYIKVAFTVIDPVSGQTVQGQQEVMRTDLKNQPLPEVGTPLAVLYLNTRLYRVL